MSQEVRDVSHSLDSQKNQEGDKKRITKLEEIFRQLLNNHLYCTEMHEFKSGFFDLFVRIITAPKEPITEIPQLNEFMQGLTPSIKPSIIDLAKIKDGKMQLGHLIYDESFKTNPNFDNPEIAGKEISCRTVVTVYPHEGIAKTLYGYVKGLEEGRTSNQDFENLRYWLAPEQIVLLREGKGDYSTFAREVGLFNKVQP